VKEITYLVDFATPNIVKFQKQNFGRKIQLSMFTHGLIVMAALVSKKTFVGQNKKYYLVKNQLVTIWWENWSTKLNKFTTTLHT